MKVGKDQKNFTTNKLQRKSNQAHLILFYTGTFLRWLLQLKKKLNLLFRW